EPKVITYNTLITQVCLLLKILYCRSKLVRMAPGKSFNKKTVANKTAISTISFGMPKPEPLADAGKISHKPAIDVTKPMPSMARIILKDFTADGSLGVTSSVWILLVPNQSKKASGTKVISQAKPAFWIQVAVPAGITPVTVPLALASTIGSPPPSRVKT